MSEELLKIKALARALGWSAVEFEHAIGNLDCQMANESVIRLENGRELHFPAHPQNCEYVRVMQNGYELAYWDAEEWAERSMEVMGAIMGAAHG